jgi:SAM-dependent methyltransferase
MSPRPSLKKRLYQLLRRLAGGRRPGHPVSRFVMYSTLAEMCRPFVPEVRRCLVISGSGRLAMVLGIPSEALVTAAYPEVDVRSLPYADEEFDAVVSDQVLEHVEAPPLGVIEEAARVVRPGGLLVHTTCFVNPRHDAPSDYWRFSPEGLRLLHELSGHRVVHTGAWGNRYVLAGDAIALRFLPVNTSRRTTLTYRLATLNQPKWPISTWVVALRGGRDPH